MFIDLNCDLGEGAGHDAELLTLVSSANVCCAAHAGDAATSLATVQMAAKFGVSVGAHPGLPDWAHFGRCDIAISETQLTSTLIEQVAGLQALATSCAVQLRHIKLHGALYHQATANAAIARIAAEVARQFQLPMLGLPMSELECACAGRVDFVREGFADRRYLDNGRLVPRDRPDAFVESATTAVEQVEKMVADHGVRTICVHGDRPDAVTFVTSFRQAWLANGHGIRSWQ